VAPGRYRTIFSLGAQLGELRSAGAPMMPLFHGSGRRSRNVQDARCGRRRGRPRACEGSRALSPSSRSSATRSFKAVHGKAVAAGAMLEPAAQDQLMSGGCAHRDRQAGCSASSPSSRQRVVAALEQPTGDRQAGADAAEPGGGLLVVVAVGRARPARRLGGLEQRPAQGWRALAREVAGGALAVRLGDGDVHAGVADRLTGAREAGGRRRARP
jgi:hypothetical protein